jgi:hypothetical protein
MNISGGVSVSPISGVVSVSGPVSGNVAISGAVSGVFSVSGAVAVSNAVSGIFSVSGPVSGVVSVSGAVSVTNALSGVVSVSGIASISGTVSVSGVASVSGTVSLSGTVNAQGSQADAATATANPFQMAYFARTTNRTAVADSQVVRALGDDLGRGVLILNQVRDLVTQNRLSIAVATETQILAAGATGVFHDLTYFKVSNESQVMTRADLRDATGGTVRWTSVLVPGGTTNDILMVPFKQTSAATDWTLQLSVTATVHVTIQAVKNV